ncbi:MAG: HAD family phosphatase [Caldilineaceae bacterium]|nr:HAD family phosphatase [Caldilineaceae bacterium]MCB0122415.1 HAD family phosphatase [Caldilineaceae bacterium]
MTVNPKELTAVIFDMDGTMVDTESIYHIAWQELATDLGYTLDQTMLKATTGRRISDCYAIIQAALGADFPMQHFQEQWWNYWTRHVQRHGIARKAGLDQLLNLLDAHAIPKAVATSSERTEALYTLDRAGIADRFSILVTGDQIQHGKPAPDIFLLAAERLGVDAQHCLALEDSEAGVQAATAAGMTTFMVPDRIQPSLDIAERAFRVVDTLHEVHDWIVEEWLAVVVEKEEGAATTSRIERLRTEWTETSGHEWV